MHHSKYRRQTFRVIRGFPNWQLEISNRQSCPFFIHPSAFFIPLSRPSLGRRAHVNCTPISNPGLLLHSSFYLLHSPTALNFQPSTHRPFSPSAFLHSQRVYTGTNRGLREVCVWGTSSSCSFASSSSTNQSGDMAPAPEGRHICRNASKRSLRSPVGAASLRAYAAPMGEGRLHKASNPGGVACL